MAPNFGSKNEFIPKFLKIQPETKVKRVFTRSIKSPIEFTESPIDSSETSGSFFESSVSFISSGTSLESSTHFKATGSSISNTGTFVGASRSSATIFESSGYSSTYFSTLISPESPFKSKTPIDSELFGSSYGSFVPLDSFGSSGPILKKSAIEPFGLTSATVLKAKVNSSWEDSRMFPTDLIGNTLIEMVASANTEHPEIPVAVVNKIDYGIRMNAATLVMNASSVNATDFPFVPDLFYRHSLAMTAVYCVAYLLVFAVGLVGNCFVIAVVFRSPRMRTVTNFFIVNLAVADILVIIFCLPATLMSNIFVPWVLGWWMCKTVPYVQGVSVAASVYSLIAVSLDRFLAIWWPLKCQITKRRARLMIFIIWVIALTTTIPWALFFDLVVIFSDAPDIQLCLEVWPDALNGALYFLIANLLFCYILPMILITMCYILIWIKVWKRHIPTDTKDAQMERMQQKSKVKVVKMLVAVVILFVVSWLPLYVIFARIKLGKDIAQWEEEILPIATPIAQWLGASNSCINPILYAFFNKKYRRGFMAIVKSRRCCGRLRYYETVAMMSSSTSMRKSSHYFNNNNSSTRRVPPDTAVSYIYNNTGVLNAWKWPL